VIHEAGAAVFEFGGFRLEPQRRLLSRDGEPVALTDKAFDALAYLVEHAGQLVTKDDLMRALWPDVIVEENNLYVVISTLRRALKDESTTQRLIATVAGRGYQFVARVQTISAGTHVPAPSVAPVPPVPSAWYSRLLNRRIAWLSVATLLLAIGITAAVVALRPAKPSPSVVTLAVLPFKPLTPADRNESLEFGMAETLIAGLNADRLSVSPLSSVRRFSGSEQDVLAAGRALGVQAVLEGHIQRANGELRVSARLLNVSDGRQLWAERYDEAFTDIFSVQDAIAAKVRAALRVHLSADASPVLRRYTADSEAYQLYANGRFHLNRANEEGSRAALANFEQAVERDPQFALAYVGIAEAHAILGVFGSVAPRDTFPQARRAVDRALEIAPELGEAYASLGHIKVQYEHDWSGAERAYRRAIELNPTFARASAWYGLLLGSQGQFDESLVRLRRAQELEPAQPIHAALIGMVLMYQRRYEDAIEQLQLTLQMDPNFPTTNTYLAAAYLRRGDYEKAMGYLGHARTLAPGSQGYAGQIHALSGRRAAALQEIQRLRVLSTQRYVSADDIATIYAALGQHDETFEWLERAFEERSPLIGWLRWDAVFDGIRADARYVELARRVP
jgi:DNA-binding winged helix-turn-helix (wHTH) protein/TolB-like protein/Tfp pilus assembly protein PilF